MPEKAWKQFERRVARFFHADGRTPLSGSTSRHTASDTLHDTLYIECKQRKKKSAAVSLFRQTEALARKEKKVPVVALQQTGDTRGWLLVIRPQDLFAVAHAAKDFENLPKETLG